MGAAAEGRKQEHELEIEEHERWKERASGSARERAKRTKYCIIREDDENQQPDPLLILPLLRSVNVPSIPLFCFSPCCLSAFVLVRNWDHRSQPLD